MNEDFEVRIKFSLVEELQPAQLKTMLYVLAGKKVPAYLEKVLEGLAAKGLIFQDPGMGFDTNNIERVRTQAGARAIKKDVNTILDFSERSEEKRLSGDFSKAERSEAGGKSPHYASAEKAAKKASGSGLESTAIENTTKLNASKITPLGLRPTVKSFKYSQEDSISYAQLVKEIKWVGKWSRIDSLVSFFIDRLSKDVPSMTFTNRWIKEQFKHASVIVSERYHYSPSDWKEAINFFRDDEFWSVSIMDLSSLGRHLHRFEAWKSRQSTKTLKSTFSPNAKIFGE